jgi:uncharacterized protein YbaR (Trm112 family)
MTAIPESIRALLACPRCGGPLRDEQQGVLPTLVCEVCALVFPVEEGIPVLLAERAQPRAQG